MPNIQIAIDGPGGSGKSTIAKLLANELGFVYIDTGAMYRACALYCLDNNIDIQNSHAVESVLPNINIEIKHVNGQMQIFLNGADISHRIRSPNISNATSVISTYSAVRDMLVDQQKRIAESTNIVMDGRDIGTVVLPWATHKIFLTASVAARVQRRSAELLEKNGQAPSTSDIETEIMQRDHRDITREISPLKQANDAVLIDTSNMTIEQVIKKITAMVKKV